MNRPYHNVRYDEKAEKYTLEVALPGIGKDDVTIETKDELLHIATQEKEDGKESFIDLHGRTWNYRLPSRTDVEAISAVVENGILRIEMPLKVVRRSIKVA